MLKDYVNQDNIYTLLINEIENNHISHAYLIDENGNSESFNIVLAFIKEILCIDLDKKEKEILCKRIDDGNYPEIKIIEPDGMLIKKQQILDLQKEFSLSAVEGSRRFYIIRDCEKMRPETANSMLKFLEEPETDIVAFLMTNNVNNILSTIVSRCQMIRLGNDIIKRESNDLDDIVLNFIDKIETIGKKTILLENELIFNNISSKNREQLVCFFDKIIDMYYDMMKIIISDGKNKDILYYNELIKYLNNNNKKSILKKINSVVDAKEAIKFNVNCNLLIDNLILNIGG